MSDVYSRNVELNESEMKEEVLSFFDSKKKFLSDLRVKYGSRPFAGSEYVAKIYTAFEAITKSHDAATVFNEVISRKDSLEENVDILEQLEAFYKEGSSQQKLYNEALEIVEWYDRNNTLFGGLDEIATIVAKMGSILNMAVPFSKMSELGDLVYQSKTVKDKILEDKYQKAINYINNDKEQIKKEEDNGAR